MAKSEPKSQVIKVCDEIPCCKTPLDDANLSEIFKSICGGVEPLNTSKFSRRVVQPRNPETLGQNALVSAVHTAWVGNYPLVLTPDVIWTAIQQGCARRRDVRVGQLGLALFALNSKCKAIPTSTLQLKVGTNKTGSSDYWAEVFQDFAEKIKEADPSACTPSFSTSGPQERAVAHLSLMRTRSLDYDYVCVPTYGIPTITVTGTKEDWTLLRDNALMLASKCSDKARNWGTVLEPVLDQFISAASGEFDLKFWKSIYHCYADKTSTTFSSSGWVFALLPFLHQSESLCLSLLGLSKYLSQVYGQILARAAEFDSSADGDTCTPISISYIQQPGICGNEIPSGVVTTDETYRELVKGILENNKLHSGFMAVGQDKHTMAIHAEIGWAVSSKNC